MINQLHNFARKTIPILKLEEFNWVVCVGVPWNPKYVYSIGNIVIELNRREKKILWINPALMFNKSYVGSHPINKTKKRRNIILRLFFEIKTYIFFFNKIDDNFFLVTPFLLPVFREHYFYNINRLLLQVQFLILRSVFRVNRYLLYTSGYYDAYIVINFANYVYWIHHFPDIDSDNRNINESQRNHIFQIENNLILSCDYVLASSQRIFDKIISRSLPSIKLKDKVILFPHGVDFYHFYNSKPVEKNQFIINRGKPVVGYFGSLTNANDQDTYIALAKAGYNLLIIGDVLYDYSECKKFPNIIFTGGINYKDVPSYVKCMDVGIMSWKISEHILNSNPKKTLEFLSCGIPVVSNPIPQLVHEFGDIIYYAKTPDEFVQKVDLALKENSEIKILERVNLARQRDWGKKIDFLFNV